jgi:glycosyltransferase involved in cell wall biosynthesis
VKFETQISVIVPTYNSAEFISSTLITVVEQTYKNFEVVISDDGSEDETLEIVKNFFSNYPTIKHKILENKHEGPGATRNKGVSNASYDWIAFLDSDDSWENNKLEEVVKVINSSDSNIIFHNEFYKYPGSVSPLNHHEKFSDKVHPFIALYRENFLSPSATTLRKDLFDSVNGFDISLPSAQDYDLWLRIAVLPRVNIYCIPVPLGYYTVRDGSITSNVAKRMVCMLKIYDKNIPNVKKFSSMPILDLLRFKGRVFSVLGLRLVRQKKVLKGTYYIIKGMIIWPRFDWIKKLFRRVLKA